MKPTLIYSTAAPAPLFRRTFNLCAVAVMLSVFPLIWMGGLVTSHGAGMSVPDWPNSYGYNMFLFPIREWVGGIWYEHTHRLLGTLSGFLSIGLALLAFGPARKARIRAIIGTVTLAMLGLLIAGILFEKYLADPAWLTDEIRKNLSHLYVLFGSLALIGAIAWCCRIREPRRWMRRLTILQLGAIIVQGTLGGLRVTEVNTELAIIHGCFAQAFFCLTGFTALATSSWWIRARDLSAETDAPAGRTALWLAGLATLIIAAQLILGATMRHKDAALAIPDLPLAFGKILPPLTETELERANQIRAWDYHLPEASFVKVWLHFGHRAGAILVTISVLLAVIQVFKKLPGRNAARRVMGGLGLLVAIQFTLGVLTVYLKRPPDIASLHVAIGAATMLTASQGVWVLARQFARGGKVFAESRADVDNEVGQLATA